MCRSTGIRRPRGSPGVARKRTPGSPEQIIDLLPAAVYTTEADGRITSYNKATADIWGFHPDIGSSQFCGPCELYLEDGNPLPPDESPVAAALRERHALRSMPLVIARPDGRRVHLLSNPTPLFDAAGELVGAVDLLIDVSDSKRSEDLLARRVEEQSALFEFTDRLFRANAMADIHEAALDAILRALACQRASILLTDDSGVMRFVAWRGLSEAYRRAVEGHSPWTSDSKDLQPICIEEIDTAELDEGLKAAIRKEGIAALAFIPIVANGQLIGKFMTYYDAPHVFTGEDIGIGVTIARQLGFSFEKLRAEEAHRRSEQTKELLLKELKHRIKNTLAIVQALATQTFRQAPEDERAAFQARLQALANAHDLLTSVNWQQVAISDLVQRAIAPFQQEREQRFAISGPALSLDTQKSLLLSMALHELATNAAKYGALSQPGGRVLLRWRLLDAQRLQLVWKETGGPPVEPPARKGFGSALIERLLGAEPDTTKFEYAPMGLVCTFCLLI